MVELPRELIARLLAGPVPRADVATSLGTKGSVSMLLSSHARLMKPSHVVERLSRGGAISYRLRRTQSGEMPGQVKEAAQ